MRLLLQTLILIFFLMLLSCGGGDGSVATNPPVVVNLPEISLTVVRVQAYEKDNRTGKFKIGRSGPSGALSINYVLSGSSDITKGSATLDDYQLTYSDTNTVVGDQLGLAADQNEREVTLSAIDDGLHEVPETLVVSVGEGSTYKVNNAEDSVSLIISDASNSFENAKVFMGSFGPQNGAVTVASGQLSFILSGDNDSGILNYSLANLGSDQTDQHIHLAPSGTMIKDIESMGDLYDFSWDLAPGGIFKTEQEMLNTLFNGEFFVNIHTAVYQSGEISAALSYQEAVVPPTPITLSKTQVNLDILRFLNQATFGAIPEQYHELRALIDDDADNRIAVYSDWIDKQIQLPQSSLLELTDATLAKFSKEDTLVEKTQGEPGERIRRDSFWPIAIYGQDQLRQRMAFALSEILVISDENTEVRKAYRGAADYWDMLANNAFGSYRQTLEDVTKHAVMGSYLSHLRNQKADPSTSHFPDENYAREVMQLFTFGLVKRQKNGALLLGNNNLPEPTYDLNDIKEMAKVFTGLGFSYYNNGGNKVVNDRFLRGSSFNAYQYRWTEPLRFFPSHHDYDEKLLFTDKGQQFVVPASQQSQETANAELGLVLDKLVSHSSTAPVVASKLIQRFVTSNPSADYIERVATAFGDRGNLTAVIKAILLDDEARNPSVYDSNTFGKIKEPVLHVSAIMRLLEASSAVTLGVSNHPEVPSLNYSNASMFDQRATLLRMGTPDVGQRPLSAPSVFNFFSEGFSPTGDLSRNSLVAPEMELINESQLFNSFNAFHKLIKNGFFQSNGYTKFNKNFTQEQMTVKLSYARLQSVWDAADGRDTEKATAVVDYLDLYLTAGQLRQSQSNGTRDAIISAVASANADERYNLAVYGAGTAADFLLQK